MTDKEKKTPEAQTEAATQTPKAVTQPKGEIGGTQGQEPTTFGDWQHAGRCSDF